MTDLLDLRQRVTRLEERMDDVQDLAGRTGQEVADWRTTLNNHNKTLNTIRENQVDQGKAIARVEKEIGRVEKEMRDGFELLHQGQKQITDLLTEHLGERDEQTHTGGADE